MRARRRPSPGGHSDALSDRGCLPACWPWGGTWGGYCRGYGHDGPLRAFAIGVSPGQASGDGKRHSRAVPRPALGALAPNDLCGLLSGRGPGRKRPHLRQFSPASGASLTGGAGHSGLCMAASLTSNNSTGPEPRKLLKISAVGTSGFISARHVPVSPIMRNRSTLWPARPGAPRRP